MKKNKIILRICHAFGLRLDQEHIDDVTFNIYPDNYTEEELNLINGFGNRDKDGFIDENLCQNLKKRGYEALESNPRLKKKCNNAGQLWVTFKKNEDGSSIARIFIYRDGVLYFQLSKVDKENFTKKFRQ